MIARLLDIDAVVISGVGICTPLGKRQDFFAEAVIAGRSCIRSVTSFDGSVLTSDLASEFDPSDRDFGLSDAEIARMDRGAWFAMAALTEALADAGLDPDTVDSERLAVVVGTSHTGIQHIEAIYRAAHCGRVEEVTSAMLHAASTDHTATVVCARLGSRGPKATISSACASSNTAIGYGLDLLRNGEVDVVVVVGTDTVSPSILAGFNCLRAVSREPAAPFSAPSGISLGEGAGVVILERLEGLTSRGRVPRAQVRGYGLSGDAYHETATDTAGLGVEAAMREALRDAATDTGEIDYVSAHGTGTDANDIPESLATVRLFGNTVPMSSPKSILGHTLGASGVIELILTLLLAERGFVPHTANFKGARPGCPDLDYVPNSPRPGKIVTFLCNNYGFGGNNSSLVISRRVVPELGARRVARSVVITGGGVLNVAGNGLQAFFDALWAGASGVALIDEYGVPVGKLGPIAFQGRLKGYSRSSPMIKYAIAASGQAIEQASNGAPDLLSRNPYRNALIAGVSQGAVRSVEKFMKSVFVEGLQYASATHFPMTTMNASGGQVSIAYGIKGYNTTFCGGPTAFKYAFDIVRAGRQTRALTFGTDEISPLFTRLLNQTGWVCKQVVTPFADEAGVNPGEGAGALMLEAASEAEARGVRPLAIVGGVGIAQDGLANGVADNGNGLGRAIGVAFTQARVSPWDIGAVVALGTGTLGSKHAEAAGLALVFGHELPPTTSAVGAVGFAPAGLLHTQVLLAVEILRRSEVPPAAGLGALPPHFVTGAQRAVPGLRHVLVVHTSLGGEHCAVVVSK